MATPHGLETSKVHCVGSCSALMADISCCSTKLYAGKRTDVDVKTCAESYLCRQSVVRPARRKRKGRHKKERCDSSLAALSFIELCAPRTARCEPKHDGHTKKQSKRHIAIHETPKTEQQGQSTVLKTNTRAMTKINYPYLQGVRHIMIHTLSPERHRRSSTCNRRSVTSLRLRLSSSDAHLVLLCSACRLLIYY